MLPIQTGKPRVGPQAVAHSPSAAASSNDEQALSVFKLMSDSAEELTQALSGRAQEKKLRERRRAETRPDGLNSEESEEALAFFSAEREGKDGGDPKLRVDQQARSLAALLRDNPDLARQHSREGGGDDTERYLLLHQVADRLAKGEFGPDPGRRAETAAREAAAEIYAERAGRIHADLNTLPALRALGDEARELRSDYRDIVFGDATVADFMRQMLDRVPENQPEKFSAMLDAAREAAGLDLAAARPSADPVRLRALVSDLNHMKVIGTVMERCGELSQTLADRHGVESPPTATRITRELLAITSDRWVDASRFTRIAEDLGVQTPPSAGVDFLAGTRAALRDLPPQVYQSAEARDAILDAAQAALDRAIDVEEGLA